MDSSRPRDPVGVRDGDVPVWNIQTQAWESQPLPAQSGSGVGPWRANHAYTTGEVVISPWGNLAQTPTDQSSATFIPGNWRNVTPRVPQRTHVSIGGRGTIYAQDGAAILAADGTTENGIQGATSRYPFQVQVDSAGAVRFAFGHCKRAGADTAITTSFTIRASVEPPVPGGSRGIRAASGTPVPITFKGARSLTLDPGAVVWSDPVGIPGLLRGDEVYVWTYAHTASNSHQVPVDQYTAGELDAPSYVGDATDNYATAADGRAQHRIYTAMAMAAVVADPVDVDCIGLWGDSNAWGQGDVAAGAPGTMAGFGPRACYSLGLPWAMLAAPGTALRTWQYTGAAPAPLWSLMATTGSTVIVHALGTNDGGRTADQMFADLLENARLVRSMGLPFIACTIPPSYDLGQTPAGGEAVRLAYNALIRAGDDLITWVADNCSIVAADADGTRDPLGSFWWVDSDANPYGVNLHYYPPGHAAAATILADAITHVRAGDTGGISQYSTTPVAPSNTVAPAITGTAQNGQTLTCSTGTWTASPSPSPSFQWKRDGSAISGATSSTYVAQGADVGHAITCTVTMTNASGPASATSNTVTPIAAVAPVNTVAPAITGSVTTGSTLTCSTGTWTGGPTPTPTYQWKRDGVNISGATASTYVLQVPDQGTAVKCAVTMTNIAGSASHDSNTVNPTGAFDPATMTGIIDYGEADKIAGKIDGDAITTWTGLKGVMSPTQATSGSRPLYKTGVSGVTGGKAVLFDGVDDALNAIRAIPQPYDVVIVCKYTAAPPTSQNQCMWNAGSVYEGGWWNSQGGSPHPVTLVGASTISASAIDTEPSAAFHPWRFLVNGASSKIDQGAVNLVTGNAGTDAAAGFGLAEPTAGGFHSAMYVVGWYVVGQQMTGGDLSGLMNYISNTYGIS